MDRMTHSDRAKRRNQINLEAQELLNTMPFDAMTKSLSVKYDLTESYIKSILPSKLKSNCKRKKEQNIVKDLLELAGTDKPSTLYHIIADKHGLSVFQVASVCRKHQINLPLPASVRRCVDKEKQIKELIDQGMPIADIAKKLKNTRENVYRYYRRMLKEGKIVTVPATKSLQVKQQVQDRLNSHSREIIELYNSGEPIKEIADKFNIPFSNVSRYISCNNVTNVNTTALALPNGRRKWLMIMADLLNPDLSIADIAKKHNKQHSNICLFISECKKLGITIPHTRADGRRRKLSLTSNTATAWTPKVGDWVKIKKPESWTSTAWNHKMDKYDGGVVLVTEIDGNAIIHDEWAFCFEWLEDAPTMPATPEIAVAISNLEEFTQPGKPLNSDKIPEGYRKLGHSSIEPRQLGDLRWSVDEKRYVGMSSAVLEFANRDNWPACRRITTEVAVEVTEEVKNPLGCPDGWRFLEVGEVIRNGDIPFENGQMYALGLLMIGQTYQTHWKPIIRRNKFEVGERVVVKDNNEIWEIEEVIQERLYKVKTQPVKYRTFVIGNNLAPYVEG